MRKYYRQALRFKAKQMGLKESAFINRLWHRYQIERRGEKVRAINMFRGSRKSVSTPAPKENYTIPLV